MIDSIDPSDYATILDEILLQEELERVSPKLEQFRNKSIGGNCPSHIRIKGARGGRAAGAKSWGFVSLLVQRANAEKSLRAACLREIQLSLEESVYELIQKTVDRLRFPGWKFTREYIASPSGAHIIFRGLKDLRAASQMKSLEGFDLFFIEEAQNVSMASLNIMMPTLMRTPNSELWFGYNPENEDDPITTKIWNRNRTDALCIELLPGPTDNPWWNSGLQKEYEEDFKFDADEAEHIWHGITRKQGVKSVFSRTSIRGAMNRVIEADGMIEIGADIARYGDDASEFYKRRGMKVIDNKSFRKQSIPETARELWDFANRDPSVIIRVDDDGVGGGVTDLLREWGAKVIPINSAGAAGDPKKYPNIASELWFGFPMDSAQIPDDPELMRQLQGRQYEYDSRGRRVIEPKKEYKKRLNRSPDKADALLLCFLNNYNMKMSDKFAEDLARRRRGV